MSVNGHMPGGIVTLITSELVPGATDPDDGLNCAPSGELVGVQLKSPVELDALVSVTVHVVFWPVADWQLKWDWT
jgi:hypothetical protein